MVCTFSFLIISDHQSMYISNGVDISDITVFCCWTFYACIVRLCMYVLDWIINFSPTTCMWKLEHYLCNLYKVQKRKTVKLVHDIHISSPLRYIQFVYGDKTQICIFTFLHLFSRFNTNILLSLNQTTTKSHGCLVKSSFCNFVTSQTWYANLLPIGTVLIAFQSSMVIHCKWDDGDVRVIFTTCFHFRVVTCLALKYVLLYWRSSC